jgi:uncharacterized oligopeptide transporter (OPT) family protein
VTMPAILILGFDLEMTRVLLVAALGGLLGILMMIPLRRYLVVQEHGNLRFPEGTACAVVLKAGSRPDPVAEPAAAAAPQRGDAIFKGFLVGLVYKTLMVAGKGWKEVPEKVFGPPLNAGSVAAEISPELLGVGYIIGPRIAAIMCAGGVLAYLLLIPVIKFFGEGLTTALPPGSKLIANMTPGEIRGAYLLYIGAGAVSAAGIFSLLRALPIIWSGLGAGLRGFTRGRTQTGPVLRTERELSLPFVLGGILVIIAVIVAAPSLHMNLLGAVLVVLFGFLFVTVSSRLTGEIGSSSNPVSGMTIATLLLTCLIFLIVGWTGGVYYVTALSVGGIVCVAAANGGNTAQDLKTGFLLGATPRAQQIAILIGAFASALVMGPILLRLNEVGTVYVPVETVAPGLRTELPLTGPTESLRGPQSKSDANAYRVWHKPNDIGGPAGKYLVDASGSAKYLVDPGINGTHTQRPDGTEVRKFDAPKATLVSYIIKGILQRELPWGLVLFGAMISVVLELAGVSSLAFAVGVYLPLATSMTIFIGGAVRWASDRLRARVSQRTAEELSADSDRSPGVLMACGYIAGGAIAGILIAFLAGVLEPIDQRLLTWAKTHNPFFQGSYANWLSLIPFALLVTLLFRSASEKTPTPEPIAKA